MKRFITVALVFSLAIFASACSGEKPADIAIDTDISDSLIKIGFSQVGAESGWRSAHSESMKNAFCEENGYYLAFHDAHQQQQNQISAINSFIKLGVDYIILAPVTETGWDNILTEAKNANIPVIIVDRMIDVANDDLYVCWVGSNFRAEGDKAVSWMAETFKNNRKVNIAHIQGTLGSSAQIGRTDGLSTGIVKNPSWEIIAQESANFTKEQGRAVMEDILKKHDDIDVVYCENDDEALGAIEAIEASGKTVGTRGDITIVSFDATKAALEMVLSGKISYVVECNPLHGPIVEKIISDMEKGVQPEKFFYIEEASFDSATITQADVDARMY
ncbi:MAG: ABC transporter substrate-binding protein [Clostridia bacterium]|nr:ABC transporter substrate-binding protein [Clostridia bacterium]